MCSGAHDHSDYNQRPSTDSNVASTDQVRKCTHEGADSCKSKQVGKDKPNPSINASKLSVNVWGDTACKPSGKRFAMHLSEGYEPNK